MEILLSDKFYSKKSVEETISAFQSEGVAEFNYTHGSGVHKVSVSNIDANFKDSIKEEFCNFALSEEMRRE